MRSWLNIEQSYFVRRAANGPRSTDYRCAYRHSVICICKYNLFLMHYSFNIKTLNYKQLVSMYKISTNLRIFNVYSTLVNCYHLYGPYSYCILNDDLLVTSVIYKSRLPVANW